MSFKKKDQEAIAKLVMEMNKYYPDPNAEYFDDAYYHKIYDIVYKMKGQPLEDVLQQISDQLNIRVKNFNDHLVTAFWKIYDPVNGTRRGRNVHGDFLT